MYGTKSLLRTFSRLIHSFALVIFQFGRRYWIGMCSFLLIPIISVALLLTNSSMVNAQGSLATVTCRLEPNPAYLGSQANLIIEVQDVDNLYGYQLELNYDADQIEFMDSDPEKEGVNLTLETIGASQTDYVLKNQAENGLVEIITTQTGQVPGFDGNVVLAKGKLRGWGIGTVEFRFGEVILADGSPNAIPSRTVNCSGEVIPAVFLPIAAREWGE